MRADLGRRRGRWLRRALTVLALGAASAAPAAAQGIGRSQLKEMMAWGTGSLILLDQLEYAPGVVGGPLALDGVAWYGGSYDRLWVRAQGEQLTTERGGEGELEAFYGRLVNSYFDALVGGRVERRWGGDGATRGQLAVGLQGLAPLRFEVSPTLYLSTAGDLSGRLEAEYQFLLTQRLVAAPDLELNAALQEVPEWGVGRGLNDFELGLRLRYEIRREFAPYLGVTWNRKFFGTADLANAEGGDTSSARLALGVRVWF